MVLFCQFTLLSNFPLLPFEYKTRSFIIDNKHLRKYMCPLFFTLKISEVVVSQTTVYGHKSLLVRRATDTLSLQGAGTNLPIIVMGGPTNLPFQRTT